MTEETMYWITRADDIKQSLSCITTLFTATVVLMTIIFCISYTIKKTNDITRSKEYLKDDGDYQFNLAFFKLSRIILSISIPLCIIFLTFSTLMPSTKDFVAIKVIPAIINNEKLKNISSDFVDIAEKWLKDLKESKNIH